VSEYEKALLLLCGDRKPLNMAIFMKAEEIAGLTDPKQLATVIEASSSGGIWTLTDPEFLSQLAKASDEATRYAVAQNPHTPGEVLEELAKEEGRMRRAVAQNQSTPVAVLAALATDPMGYVRIAVARNASTPVEILEDLICDPESAVRFAVSENPSAPATWVQVVEATLARLQEAIRGCNSPEDMDSARDALMQCVECADKAAAIFVANATTEETGNRIA
jgi:hypothetical protein